MIFHLLQGIPNPGAFTCRSPSEALIEDFFSCLQKSVYIQRIKNVFPHSDAAPHTFPLPVFPCILPPPVLELLETLIRWALNKTSSVSDPIHLTLHWCTFHGKNGTVRVSASSSFRLSIARTDVISLNSMPYCFN
jgi:hypothetical protein